MTQTQTMKNPEIPETNKLRLSHTKVNTYIRCPWMYKERYLKYLVPRKKSKALALGACMAEGISMFRSTGSADSAKEAFMQQWVEDGRSLDPTKDLDPQRSVERGIEILDAYIERFSEDPELFIQPEIKFEEDIGNDIIFTGRLDGVIRKNEQEIAVDEDKTASYINDTYKRNLIHSYQINWYLYIANKLGLFDITGQSPTISITLSQIHKTNFTFERIFLSKPMREIDASVKELYGWAEQIRWSLKTGIFPKADSSECFKYGGCDYLPLKDISPFIEKQFIAANYRKSEPPTK